MKTHDYYPDLKVFSERPSYLFSLDPGSHPVIRTLYDHVEEVTCLRFHPREPLLASGSRDYTVKIFDYVRVHDMFSRILIFYCLFEMEIVFSMKTVTVLSARIISRNY